MRKLLGDINGLNLADEYLGGFGNGNSRQSRYLMSGLTYYLCVESTVYNDGLANLVDLIFLEEVAASVLKLLLDLLVELIRNDDRLLGSADHTVIEGLGVDNRADSQQNIRGFVNDRGSVARAYAESGFSAGVSGLYHARTAGRENDVNFLHQHICEVERGNVYPRDDTLGSACLNGSLKNYLSRLDGALFRAGVGADDNAVSCLERNKALEYRGGGRVGGGDNRADNADGVSYLCNAVSLVAFDNAAGLGVLESIVDMLRSVVVLDNLIFNDAHSRFFYRHFGKRDSLLIGSGRGSQEDFVDLLLRIFGKYLLSGSYSVQSLFKLLRAVNDFVVCHSHLLLNNKYRKYFRFGLGGKEPLVGQQLTMNKFGYLSLLSG